MENCSSSEEIIKRERYFPNQFLLSKAKNQIDALECGTEPRIFIVQEAKLNVKRVEGHSALTVDSGRKGEFLNFVRV